jgi:peroxiredoxin
MVDVGSGCFVDGVTRGSAAQEAGLRTGDLITAMDTVVIHRCDDLKNQIVGHPPGDRIHLDLRRNTIGPGSDKVAIEVTLSTRADVLHHRFVGHPMEPLELADADNEQRSYDLGDLKGRTTVIGWFLLSKCSGCSALFDRVQDAMTARKFQTAPQLLAVTPRAPEQHGAPPVQFRKSFTSSTQLALAEPETFEDFAIDDADRVHFMVVDCRGVVRFVTPIAPQGDDLDAAVDEVLAAAEQAEHSRTQRR